MTSSTVAHRDVSRSRSSVGVMSNGTNARNHSYEAFKSPASGRRRSNVQGSSARNLVEESHIRIVKDSDVRDVVAEHGDARRSHPECPASVFVGIQSCRVDHRRVDHSRAEYLHPSGSLAAGAAGPMTELALDVHFGRRLGEGEIARTEPRPRFAEESIREVSERGFEVDEAHTLVDGEAFDLRKHWRMRRIEEIATVGVAGTENANRRL